MCVSSEVQNASLTHLMISAYSLSFPLLSLHFLNITEASTLAGEKVLGSLSSEITLNRIVLKSKETTVKTHVQKVVFKEVTVSF